MTKKLPRVFAVIAFGLRVMGAWIGYAAVAIVVSAVFGMDVDGAFYFLVLAPVGFALGAVFGLKVFAGRYGVSYFRSCSRYLVRRRAARAR